MFNPPKEKTVRPGTPDPAKISFESEDEVKTFSEKQEQRQFYQSVKCQDSFSEREKKIPDENKKMQERKINGKRHVRFI